MKIKQFEDKNLSHYSYAILDESEKTIMLIDPSRDPRRYLEFAEENQAKIVGIVETHPHADFVSSHLELHLKTGATIYISKLAGVAYPHHPLDDGDFIQFGDAMLLTIHTPGHSPDSISMLLLENGKQKAVFTGDTLFIGDCGRPDLREGAGKIQVARMELAKQMYYTLRDKLMKLDDDVNVYPAHGAGTLCGKNLGLESSSTIGREKKANWALQQATEQEFVHELLKDQPFIPQYFPFDVELNRIGAPPMEKSVSNISIREISNPSQQLYKMAWIVDVRNEASYKKGHLPYSINIMEDGKFETWLGTIIKPNEQFYLAAAKESQLLRVLHRAAAIGYEKNILEGLVIEEGIEKEQELKEQELKNHPEKFTIVDVRNPSEVEESKIFSNSIQIPLYEVRNRVAEIPVDKPIVVHCAGGYRSAAASSIIHSKLNGTVKVFDLGEAIKDFQKN